MPSAMPRPRHRRWAMLLAALLAVAARAPATEEAAAAPVRTSGWHTAAGAATAIARGQTVWIEVEVRAATARRGTTHVVVVAPGGTRVHRRVTGPHRFRAGRQRTYFVRWAVPADAQLGRYAVRVGVGRPGRRVNHWNRRATSFRIVGAAPTRSPTLPVGARLPGDAACAARVRPAREIRPANRTYNRTTGQRKRNTGSLPGLYAR